MKNKILMFSMLLLLSFNSNKKIFAQISTTNTYLITIKNSENIAQQKEHLTILRDFFKTHNCVYHIKKKAFLVTTKKFYNIHNLKTVLEKKRFLNILNIKTNRNELVHVKLKESTLNSIVE